MNTDTNPLLIALKAGNEEVVECLLENDAALYWQHIVEAAKKNPHLFIVLKNHYETEEEWEACLNDALLNGVRQGEVKVVRLLLNNGANLHCRDANGRTLLHIALGLENNDVLKLLLDNLHEQQRILTMKKVKVILKAAIIIVTLFMIMYYLPMVTNRSRVKAEEKSPSSPSIPVPLVAVPSYQLINFFRTGPPVSQQSHPFDIGTDLMNPANINDVVNKNFAWTRLHYEAANSHRFDFAERLLALGAKWDVPDKYTNTALHIAVIYGNVRFVEEILKNSIGLAVNGVNCDRDTPLILAAIHGRFEIAAKLLKAPEINIYQTNEAGLNAYNISLQHKESEPHRIIAEHLYSKYRSLGHHKMEKPFPLQ